METISFHSADYKDGNAFDAYRSLYSTGSDAALTDGPFFADVKGFRYPRMLVFDRTLAGVSHERSHQRVARDGFDHVCLQYVVQGRMLVSVDNHGQVVEAGQIVAFDMTRPQRTWSERAKIITVSVARDSIEDKLPPFVDLHGAVLPNSSSALFADFLGALVRHGPITELPAATVATQTVSAFVGAIFNNATRFEASKVFHTAKLNQILSHIERNLDKPDLTADVIAAAVGVSRSVLYRMFEPLGGVVSYVQSRRLMAIRRALSKVEEKRSYKAVAEAHGFVSASHATRTFRATFGVTPGEYRKTLLEAHFGSAVRQDVGCSGLQGWVCEIL